MNTDFDLAIVGSGFGGTLLAMIGRRLGLKVLLIERGRHPRFAIGESTSPLTNLLLEQLAQKYDLPRLRPLTTYGAWQRTYPEVVCGLKRGFTYYAHECGKTYRPEPDRSNQLLVAASPNNEVSDTHWLRADVDHFLLKEAIALGADYQDETVANLERIGTQGAALSLTRRGQTTQVRASLLIDAAGPRGFLHRALALPEAAFERFPPTRTLFSHFTGVHRVDAMPEFTSEGTPPYAPDDAALHHVFDGGWMWVLRFGNGITSAGVSVTDARAEEIGLSEGEPAWKRLLARYPTIGAQFERAEKIRPFDYWSRLAFRTSQAAGEGWAMLPSAAAFVDPLFSTGIPLTLLGIERLARLLETEGASGDLSAGRREYGERTLEDADWTATFVGGCFAAMPYFPLFAAYSMFYFASASFGEMARRLDRPDLARRFLGQDRPEFAEGLRKGAHWLSCRNSPPEAAMIRDFAAEVKSAVSGINIAGLCNAEKQNWYGVEWNDLIDQATCLELTPDAMRRILASADWAFGAYPG